MRPRRGRATLAVVLGACALAVGGLIAALLVTRDGNNTANAPIAPTTGSWTPITISKPQLPVIGGGIPVDVDPLIKRNDFSATLFHLGTHRYRMTIFNISNLGAINSFQWYPPTGVRVVKLIGSDQGHCTLSGLTGFGGNQFPSVVLYPNILCDKLDLKAPSCTCLGDGGDVAISFETNKDIPVDAGDLRVRAATLPFDRIPVYQSAGPRPRHVKRIIAAAGDADDGSGALSASERDDAQGALDSLQDSNISLQLVAISRWLQNGPSTCRIRLESRDPSRYSVYVFWTPWLAANPYVWLNMNVTGDPEASTFQLGTAQPVLPGGRLKANGRSVNRRSVDTTLLSRYGPDQARAGRKILLAHGGNVFAQPSSPCQVLKNGALKLLP